MLEAYKKIEKERAELGIPPEPLDAEQAADLVELIKENSEEGELLLDLLINRVPAGVDDAAYVKAAFLKDIATKKIKCELIDPKKATFYLGTMLGGYNVEPLINLLDDEECGDEAVKALSQTLLVFDAFNDVAEKSKDSSNAAKVLNSWAEAEWFTSKPEVPQSITTTVFKVPGETNTDDLSPAPDAWSRPDIPLHALAMYKMPRQGLSNDPLGEIKKLKEKGHPVCLVGDVVGTGSSRKSATNSVLWHMGDDIPFIPNKRTGGICIGTKIAPIFFNTMEDAGTLVFEADVEKMETGDVITIFPHQGRIENESSENISSFQLKSETFLDEVRAGGRIPLIIGRSLTDKARDFLNLSSSDVFVRPGEADESNDGYTLAQKIVGKACGVEGIRPGTYCEPVMSTVGSQDTTGPMTRDELKELACLGFTSDLVMQSFCHTAAYPKPVDIETQHTLPEFIKTRGGVALQPGDGIIHSWRNRMLLPDTVGTGGDSHTRFPMGISFPGGSGLVAFAAATGVMPLDMPESVLVRFTGKVQSGITLRDLVHAIPYAAKQKGLLTTEKKNKKNVFSGRILEIEGLPDLTCEQAFELSDASAERSAAGCTIKLNKEPIIEYLQSNIVLLEWMIREGYGDVSTIQRRIENMKQWIDNPVLMEADKDANYANVINIDLDEISEPILCAPNDPDNAVLLSDVCGEKIDEVFIGSCMTNIGHFRAAGNLLQQDNVQLKSKLWIAPPTKMDEQQLKEEGYYDIFRNKDTTCLLYTSDAADE